ncbi:MAG: NAD(P)/FAD-dependent oxidoreductase [bacterium]
MQNQKDVLIIGGGAIGICTAYYLWKNGANVAVLEKDEICSGCSYGNSGLIVPSHIIPLAAPGMIAKGLKWMFDPESPFYLKPRFDLDFFSWLWKFHTSCTREHVQRSIPILHELLVTSASLYDEIARAKLFDFGLRKKGLLQLYRTEKEFRADLVVAERARQAGLQVSALNPDQIHALEPKVRTRAVGGIYYHSDAHLEPANFVRHMSHYLAQQGVSIRTHTEVLKLKASRNRLMSVQTSSGEFTGNEIVLAGGAWSTQLLQPLRMKLPLQAGKGYSITISASQEIPSIPFILHEARVGITPMNGKLRFAGTMELAGLGPAINQRRVRAILKAVPEYFYDWDPLPQMATAEIWGGMRPCTPDGMPYIGRFLRYPNLIAATGHAMLGIALAPVTGKLISEIVLGKQPAIPLTALRCERFE